MIRNIWTTALVLACIAGTARAQDELPSTSTLHTTDGEIGTATPSSTFLDIAWDAGGGDSFEWNGSDKRYNGYGSSQGKWIKFNQANKTWEMFDGSTTRSGTYVKV